MKTSIFMVPGVLSMALCLLTVLLTSMSLSKEKELGTFETLLASPARPSEILLGKSVPYIILAMIDVPIILGVAVWGFGVPMRGSVLVLMLSAFVFFCTTVACGILISTIARNQQQAMMGSFMFIFPALMLSGLFFPVENMPRLLRGIAYIDPLWYFLGLIRNIMLKGGDPGVIGFDLGMLTLMAVLAVWASVKRFHEKLD
jgi:ABC-2 type transport system permease protein